MATLFLVIIYFAFISLGLPDSLLGVAWPVMHIQLGAQMQSAGLISMSIAGGTILSSFASGYVLKRLGTGKVTFISCLMTACALLGFSFAHSLVWLLLLAIPLGLGAGSVDAGLNNYVATHYKAHHMSWLHCFWGVGATLGPIIMSRFIANNSWRNGYRTVALIQFGLVILLFVTLPLWEKVGNSSPSKDEDLEAENKKIENTIAIETEEENVINIKGVKLALAVFMFYCAGESTVGLWGSSYLVNIKGIGVATAASIVSLYYGGITIGRLITGFITMRVKNPTIIRIGQCIAFIGALFVLLPLPKICIFFGFVLIGLGFAPVFPCMIHETPTRFGKANSQKIIGFQMAFGYIGATFFPPILGYIAAGLSISIMPFFVLSYIVIMLICAERIRGMFKSFSLKKQIDKEQLR